MLVGKNNGSNIPQILHLSWATVGSVQSPGVTQRKELQVHWMVKHLNLDSMLSGFNVQLSQLMVFQKVVCNQSWLILALVGITTPQPSKRSKQKILIKFL